MQAFPDSPRPEKCGWAKLLQQSRAEVADRTASEVNRKFPKDKVRVPRISMNPFDDDQDDTGREAKRRRTGSPSPDKNEHKNGRSGSGPSSMIKSTERNYKPGKHIVFSNFGQSDEGRDIWREFF